MLERLVIGTANWGRDYNGHCVDETQQQLIMEYMKEVGIEWLDVATAYGTENVGEDEFKRIVKISDTDKFVTVKDLCEHKKDKWLIAHSVESYEQLLKYFGVSGVSIDFAGPYIGEPRIIEFPYSVMQTQMPDMFAKLIARSIFCKGKALKYFSPRECIDFVLMNPRIDKVILGVDSVDQLRENIAHLVKMEKFEHNEETDTRKF